MSMTETVDPTVKQLLEIVKTKIVLLNYKVYYNQCFLLKYFLLKVLFNDVLYTCTLSTLEIKYLNLYFKYFFG